MTERSPPDRHDLMRLTIDIDEHIYAFAESQSLKQGNSIEEVIQQMLRESFPTQESSKLDLPDLPNIKEALPITPDSVVQLAPKTGTRDSL